MGLARLVKNSWWGNTGRYVVDLMRLLLLIVLFYIVVFIFSDCYLLPKIDRYLDDRKKRRDK